MKRVYQLKNLFFLVAAVLGMTFFNACNPDETPIVFGPNTTATLISSDTLSASDSITVTLAATKGDTDLKSIEVRRSGSLVDFSEISFNGDAATSNPRLLFAPETDGFTYTIKVKAHSTGDDDYDFIVTDEGGELSTDSYTITIEDAMPTVTVSGNGMYLTDVNVGASFEITADGMGSNLTSIAFKEAGTLLDIAMINFNGVDVAANPIDITPIATFDAQDVIIRPGSALGIKNYTVEVTTESGAIAEAAFTIEVRGVDGEFTFVLLENAAGPNATGGINLYTGTTVSVNAADAYLIDLGNDGVPSWRQQIGGANGCTLRAMSQAQMDSGLTYASITSNSVVKTAFDNANALSGNESAVVSVGDVFFAQVDDDYFAISCANIGTNMGLGFYEFDIKKAENQ